jgi:hypothetical protein
MSDRTRVPGQQAWMNVDVRVAVTNLCKSAPGTGLTLALLPQCRGKQTLQDISDLPCLTQCRPLAGLNIVKGDGSEIQPSSRLLQSSTIPVASRFAA